MRNKSSLLLSISAFALSVSSASVLAQKSESQSKMKIEDTKEKKNKVDGDVDQEVTNPLLRASMGSKSRYSMQLGVQYEGGSLTDPFAATRPDIYGTPDVQNAARLNTSVSARYRWSKTDSIGLGASFGVSTPFQGHVPNRQVMRNGRRVLVREDQLNVGNPGVDYNKTFAAVGLQHSFSVGMSAGTSVESRRINLLGSLGVGYTALKAFQNGVTLGLSNSISTLQYTEEPRFREGPGGSPRYRVNVLPFFEYAFTDRVRFRTISRYMWFQNNAGDSRLSRWTTLPGSQSAGIGFSINRDIWIYPNVQWDWASVSDLSETTNVAINATINVF